MHDEPDDDLEQHEPGDEQQRKRQVAKVCVCAYAMRMSVMVVPMRMRVVVAIGMHAHITNRVDASGRGAVPFPLCHVDERSHTLLLDDDADGGGVDPGSGLAAAPSAAA